MNEDRIKEQLLKENDHFREMYEQHQIFEKELRKLANKAYLSEEDKIKEKEIKKKKLALKDKMYFLMDQYSKARK